MSSELGSFTPIPHSLAQEVGLVCAAVYGEVWRYCQMKDGSCKASLDTLGSGISVDRATVMRSIKKLCELGYLKDQTPDRRNAPHTYILSKTVAESNRLEDETVAVDNNLNGKSVAESNSSSQSVAENNATVAQRKATVAESYLSIDSEKTKDINQEEETRAREKRHQDFGTVCKAYQYEIGGLSQTISNTIDDDLKLYPADWIIEAMKRSALANRRSYSYAQGILRNWQAIGGPQNDKPKGQYKNGAINGRNQTQTTNQTRTPAQGHSTPSGTGQAEQNGGLSEVSAKLGAALRAQARGGRDPT